jgi:hypothetical protein
MKYLALIASSSVLARAGMCVCFKPGVYFGFVVSDEPANFYVPGATPLYTPDRQGALTYIQSICGCVVVQQFAPGQRRY